MLVAKLCAAVAWIAGIAGIATLPCWNASLGERLIRNPNPLLGVVSVCRYAASETSFGAALSAPATFGAPNIEVWAMQFTRVIGPVEDMEIWNGNGNGFSFVISYENRSGTGFHGRTGFVASWRPIHRNRSATRVGGSPFKTLGDAKQACNAMVGLLTKAGPMGGREARVNFDATAVLRKWPSLRNERRIEGTDPYLLIDGTLDECIRQFIAKPISTRHLYEIHTAPQPPLVNAVLPVELIVELARLRDFL